MLYTYLELDGTERRVLNRIDELQRDLRYFVVQNPKRWTGILARMTRARALRASNSIENINVDGSAPSVSVWRGNRKAREPWTGCGRNSIIQFAVNIRLSRRCQL